MYFKFGDEVHYYQKFVRDNIDNLGNLKIISEQLYLKSKDKHFIDMLALDLDDNRLVIIELKNIKAKDKMVFQPIKYYDLLLNGYNSLINLLINAGIDANNINLNPKIMIVVPDFEYRLLKTLSYIEGIDIDVIKFNVIQQQNYYEIVKEIYIPTKYEENVYISDKISKNWNYEEYIKKGISVSKLNNIRSFINILNNITKEKGKDFNAFFYENKITILINNQVYGNINLKNSNLSSIDFVLNKNVDSNDLIFDGKILKYKILSKNVKINFEDTPINFFKKHI